MGRRDDDEEIERLEGSNRRLKTLVVALVLALLGVAGGSVAFLVVERDRHRERESKLQVALEKAKAEADSQKGLAQGQLDQAKKMMEQLSGGDLTKALPEIGGFLNQYKDALDKAMNDPAINPGGTATPPRP